MGASFLISNLIINVEFSLLRMLRDAGFPMLQGSHPYPEQEVGFALACARLPLVTVSLWLQPPKSTMAVAGVHAGIAHVRARMWCWGPPLLPPPHNSLLLNRSGLGGARLGLHPSVSLPRNHQ